MTPDEWAAVKALVEQYLEGDVPSPWDIDYVCETLGIEIPDPVAA